jgi:hypothetical protein
VMHVNAVQPAARSTRRACRCDQPADIAAPSRPSDREGTLFSPVSGRASVQGTSCATGPWVHSFTTVLHLSAVSQNEPTRGWATTPFKIGLTAVGCVQPLAIHRLDHREHGSNAGPSNWAIPILIQTQRGSHNLGFWKVWQSGSSSRVRDVSRLVDIDEDRRTRCHYQSTRTPPAQAKGVQITEDHAYHGVIDGIHVINPPLFPDLDRANKN